MVTVKVRVRVRVRGTVMFKVRVRIGLRVCVWIIPLEISVKVVHSTPWYTWPCQVYGVGLDLECWTILK
jgi:hypothetical protein